MDEPYFLNIKQFPKMFSFETTLTCLGKYFREIPWFKPRRNYENNKKLKLNVNIT